MLDLLCSVIPCWSRRLWMSGQKTKVRWNINTNLTLRLNSIVLVRFLCVYATAGPNHKPCLHLAKEGKKLVLKLTVSCITATRWNVHHISNVIIVHRRRWQSLAQPYSSNSSTLPLLVIIIKFLRFFYMPNILLMFAWADFVMLTQIRKPLRSNNGVQ